MIDTYAYILTVLWRDSGSEDMSNHETLREAAKEAFRLADELSLPGFPRHAMEVRVIQGEKLQLSITINPGEPLTRIMR